jgi:ribosome biogenesis GTPase A
MSQMWAMVWRMVDQADVVVQVVDARFPSICRSNQLEKKIAEMDDTGFLIALNKSDLIPKSLLDQWIDWFSKNENLRAAGVSAKKRLGTSRIRQEILRQTSKKSATVAIVGFPNTGKSSLINTLKGKKSASTAPIAGHTRALQKIKVSNSLMMYDTPGVIPMKLPEKHRHLLGLMSLTKLKDPIGVAYSLYEQYEEINPGAIGEYYSLNTVNYDFLEDFAVANNRVLRGGDPDIRTAALMFLKDHMRGEIPIYEDINNPLRYQL